MVGFNFAPRNWAFCDGQILPINQNQSLYSLLGTLYGGDGRTSFALPDLRGRSPLHRGDGGGSSNFAQGSKGGEETHTLGASEMPQHSHQARGTSVAAASTTPTGNLLGTSSGFFKVPGTLTTMAAANLPVTGGSQAHQNMQPYLPVNFCIALQGLFPSRN